jgi:hypothetical protein
VDVELKLTATSRVENSAQVFVGHGTAFFCKYFKAQMLVNKAGAYLTGKPYGAALQVGSQSYSQMDESTVFYRV